MCSFSKFSPFTLFPLHIGILKSWFGCKSRVVGEKLNEQVDTRKRQRLPREVSYRIAVKLEFLPFHLQVPNFATYINPNGTLPSLFNETTLAFSFQTFLTTIIKALQTKLWIAILKLECFLPDFELSLEFPVFEKIFSIMKRTGIFNKSAHKYLQWIEPIHMCSLLYIVKLKPGSAATRKSWTSFWAF